MDLNVLEITERGKKMIINIHSPIQSVLEEMVHQCQRHSDSITTESKEKMNEVCMPMWNV